MTPFVLLRSFLETYRCGSVSRAAAQLDLTQPAVSAHLRSLETMMDRALFTRSVRGVAPTPAGHELAAVLSAGFDGIEAGFATLRARSQDATGPVRIAGPSEFFNAEMAEPLAQCARSGLIPHLILGGKDVIYAALDTGDADLAITASRPAKDDIGHTHIRAERLLPVAAPDWITRQLAGRATLAAALSHPPVVYNERPAQMLDLLVSERIEAQPLAPAAVIPDLRLMARLVREGIGWAVIPDYLAAPALANESLQQLATVNPPPVNHLYLVWKKSQLRMPRVALARDILRQALTGEGDVGAGGGNRTRVISLEG